MNEHQAHLLKLVREVDGICKRHNIRYYCAGGTVIGAARHKGFIPWDDDVDIYMTRDEFKRFITAFQEEKPEGRSLVYRECEEYDYRSVIARYIEDSTTMFGRYHMIGNSPAGTLVDIFILDPVPDSREEQYRYLEKFFVYCDIVMPFYSFSHRVKEENYGLYDQYHQKLEEEGYDKVVKELEEELFSYPEESCHYYALRWGTLPHIFPKEMMGEPVYLPFEDEMLPMPGQWYRYLVMLYGTEWRMVPYADTRDEHDHIKRYDISYERFYEERDERYTQEKLQKLYDRTKEARRDLEQAYRPIESFMSDFRGKISASIVDKRIEAVDLDELYQRGDYEEIISSFAPYTQLQLSRPLMGAMKHANYGRWLDPLILPIQEQNLNWLLQSLIRSGHIGEAEKLVGVYERGNSVNDAVKAARSDIDTLNLAAEQYFYKKYEECLQIIESQESYPDYQLMMDYWWLAKVHTDISPEEAAELARLADLPESTDSIRKAYADYLYLNGEEEEAKNRYLKLMESSRNGAFWLDISEKMEIPAMETEAPIDFVKDNVVQAEQQLLAEVAMFCDEHDIKYIMGPKLARRMFMTGNIGYSRYAGRLIYMDAENAYKFMNEFERSPIEHRHLLSWQNDDTIRDFQIIYTDDNSVSADFRRLDEWHNIGTRITIRILRSGTVSKMRYRQIYYGEFLMNLMHLEEMDNRVLEKSLKKKLTHGALSILMGKDTSSQYRKIFNRSIEVERKAEPGKYYYLNNERGRRPTKRSFPEKEWNETVTLEMDGVRYRIPKSATAPQFRSEPSLSNARPNPSIFFFRSDEITWAEVDKIIDMERYRELDWIAYGNAKSRLDTRVEKSMKPWYYVLRRDAVITLNEQYKPLVADIQKLIEEENSDEAGRVLSDLDNRAKEFLKKGIVLDLDEDVQRVYVEYLKLTRQKKTAKKISKFMAKQAALKEQEDAEEAENENE